MIWLALAGGWSVYDLSAELDSSACLRMGHVLIKKFSDLNIVMILMPETNFCLFAYIESQEEPFKSQTIHIFWSGSENWIIPHIKRIINSQYIHPFGPDHDDDLIRGGQSGAPLETVKAIQIKSKQNILAAKKHFLSPLYWNCICKMDAVVPCCAVLCWLHIWLCVQRKFAANKFNLNLTV